MVSSGSFEARRGMHVSGGRIASFAPVALALVATLTACIREPLDDDCPLIAEGALVLTEIRGPQTGSYPQWFEFYNASDAAIPVRGVRVQFTDNVGDKSFAFFLRDADLIAEPGDYLVIGGGSLGLYPYLDYDYTPDHHSSTKGNEDVAAALYSGGTLELSTCGQTIDRVAFALAPQGTLALDGSAPPDAATNDRSKEGWCFDTTSMGPIKGVLNGTPGEANPVCP